ncbi:sulfotransferase [Erythrobacter sp. Alg231-14]|uniref:sulfotransferase n=1 Tax=Erythrobacter sp. Alg231-14 TaxID=1922225 RepID=UPI00307C9E72
MAAKSFGERAKLAESGGRSSIDVTDFRLRLEKLTEAIRTEADLNPLGQAMAYGQLIRVIGNRLALGAYWETNPFPRDAELMELPIMVVGHMRSGTTRIHKLLASDPAHSHTRYCDAWRPLPGNLTLRRLKGSLDLTMMGALNPWLQSIHPMASGAIEEELAWLAGALNHSIYETQWRIPSFSEFSEARDATPIYSEFGRILVTDSLHRGTVTRPRVMKAPQFSEDLAVLLAMYPGARLVIAERDNAAVLRSAVSLAANQMAIQSNSCDLAQIEALWAHKITLRDAQIEAALQGWKGPVARLNFDDLNTDWEGEIARTYRELDLSLSSEALTAMRAMMTASETGHHRSHASQMDRFEQQN